MPVSRRSRYGPHSATSLHLPQLAVSVSASISGATTNEPDLGALTKDQLKAECRRRGQKTNGTKAELLQRLGHKMALSPALNKALSKAEQGRNGDVSVNNVRATSNGNHSKMARERLRVDRKALVPWRHPITTVKYASLESWILMQTYGKKFLEHRTAVVFLSGVLVSLCVLYNVAGPHQPLLEMTRVNLGFVLYWTGLGVLSSVGFGTGLHTFLLYLGPHIAAVTIAAYECDSLNFPEPPYPEEIVCPSAPDPTFADSVWIMQVMAIMSKVRLEAFLWGMGTALGELPPYFMARAARFSGYDPEDAEDLAEFEELQKRLAEGANLGLVDRAKLVVEKLVERVGFLGILACASIPNPLFDLAGITCGHFLVPFWTFFGATLIGKAVVKMHIQKIFVIIAFNETLIEEALQLLVLVPMIGPRLQEPFKKFLNNQKTRLHRQGGAHVEGGNVLASVFEVLVFVMVLYFVLSIIKSLAQRYHKRVHKKGGPRRKIARD